MEKLEILVRDLTARPVEEEWFEFKVSQLIALQPFDKYEPAALRTTASSTETTPASNQPHSGLNTIASLSANPR